MVMDYPPIEKDVASFPVTPNMPDYEALRRDWSWDAIRAELDRPGGMVNQAYECIDRHAMGPRRDQAAMIWEANDGHIERYSFEDMRQQSNKFANVMKGLGVAKADRV